MGTNPRSQHFLPKFFLSLAMMSLLVSSCVENTGVRGKANKAITNLANNPGSGSNALPDADSDATAALQSVRVELSHVVDPFDGSYKKKLSIPKNFKGNLYLAGLNVGALSNKLVKVRFNYGLDRQSVTLDATVARAPGIIPQTDIQVLVINMNGKPFKDMRLGYDLYDYNDYTTDPTKEPVTDPRDSGLYCRGLQLEDDPTFDSSTAVNATCSTATDKCLYAYAKITDATLYTTSTSAAGLTSIPTRPQVWSLATGSAVPTAAASLGSMCLPDAGDVAGINNLFSLSLSSITYGTAVSTMFYRGPYRAINTSSWKITSNAIFSSNGLFETKVPAFGSYTGLSSLLFPRAGRLALNQDIRYAGSSSHFGARSTLVANSSGTTEFVDGCNIRAMNYNTATAEGIGSCTVNASIEVFYRTHGPHMTALLFLNIELLVLHLDREENMILLIDYNINFHTQNLMNKSIQFLGYRLLEYQTHTE